MKILKQITAVLLIISLLPGCESRHPAGSSASAEDGTESEAISETAQIDIDELMERYIIPYEYFSIGQNWDFEDQNYEWPYDPDDIFSRQVSIDYPVEGFALGVIVRELPEQARKTYISSETDWGVSYNVTGPLWDAVSRFYFGVPATDPRDSLHAGDIFDDGLPQHTENEGLAITLGRVETLESGDIYMIIDRTLNGRPILSCGYTLRPFTVGEVPVELNGVFKPDDTAYRFVRVEDIPYEAETNTVEIKTAEDIRELSRIANSGDSSYLKTTYRLMNDIDMQGETLEPIGQFITRNTHDPNSDGFNAVFDGQGHTIRNLKIHVDMGDPERAYSTGMFAVIGRYGQVTKLNLENCDVSFDTGESTSLGGNATGGLAGENGGAVSDCTVSGKVTGNYQVGGLIGISGWRSTVDRCSVNVSVTGEAETGTFIGSLHNALVTDCKAEGEVLAVNLFGGYDRPRGIGGFSGFMVMGTVKDCLSSAFVKTIDSADWVGGFMGYNQGEIINCLYDKRKTANWEAVDVAYQGALSDVRDISASELDNSSASTQEENDNRS